MAYRYGNRYQIKLLPQSIEDCIASDDPVSKKRNREPSLLFFIIVLILIPTIAKNCLF